MTATTTTTTVTSKSYPSKVEAGHTVLQLTTAYGPAYRIIKSDPPRDATSDEVPIIDISRAYSESLEDRKAVADEVRAAAKSTGFFYIKNHGIPTETIDACLASAKEFFHQPAEIKDHVKHTKSKYFNGWYPQNTGRANLTESFDQREKFGFRYDPKYDPAVSDVDSIPPEIKAGFRSEEFYWDGTANLPNFKRDSLAYWQACLRLAKRMVHIFALALKLPEDYFDKKISHPDAAIALNYYPQIPEGVVLDEKNAEMVSIGSHTDLQFFTLLWQDMNGGLQVLNRQGQWLNVRPIEGTIVVNLGDYIQRCTNDQFVSTVHRAKNFSPNERYSMPFFFGKCPNLPILSFFLSFFFFFFLNTRQILTTSGFDFNEKLGVLPSCVDDEHPPKYEPISCSEWVHLRFKATTVKKT